jgi:hypothetical protein
MNFNELMNTLKISRLLFHSEADFKLEIPKTYPNQHTRGTIFIITF